MKKDLEDCVHEQGKIASLMVISMDYLEKCHDSTNNIGHLTALMEEVDERIQQLHTDLANLLPDVV